MIVVGLGTICNQRKIIVYGMLGVKSVYAYLLIGIFGHSHSFRHYLFYFEVKCQTLEGR